jgi:hypothetical protein
MTLSELLDLKPAELAEAYNEACETLEWLVAARHPGRSFDLDVTLALVDRIRFAYEVRAAVNGVEVVR